MADVATVEPILMQEYMAIANIRQSIRDKVQKAKGAVPLGLELQRTDTALLEAMLYVRHLEEGILHFEKVVGDAVEKALDKAGVTEVPAAETREPIAFPAKA